MFTEIFTVSTVRGIKTAALSAAMLLSLSVVSGTSANAEFKLATVDVNRVLNESREATARRKTLQEMSDKAKAKIDAKRKPLQEMEDDLRKSKEENPKGADQYREEAKSFARYVKDTEEDLKKEYLRANKDLTDDVLEEIRTFAKKNDIQLVLDKGEKLRGPVLFGSPGADITDSIIEAINDK